MTEAVKVTPGMFGEIHPFLAGVPGAPHLKEEWARLFLTNLPPPYDFCGYALKDGGETIGFLGAIFSCRDIGGRDAVVCNLTSWFTLPEYRAKSLALLYPLLGMEECLLTNLTPTPAVGEILRGFGFRELDPFALLMPPAVDPRALLPGAGGEFITELSTIEKNLDARDLRFFMDHKNYGCSHALFRKGGEYCYFIFTRSSVKGLPCCRLHYCSAPSLFRKNAATLKYRLLLQARATFLLADPRLLPGGSPGLSLRIRRRNPTLYRAPEGTPPPGDNLYTELAALHL